MIWAGRTKHFRRIKAQMLAQYEYENVLICIGNEWSEPGGQNTLAKSELKCWLNMIRKCIGLFWEIHILRGANKTLSQNQILNVGSIWLRKCIVFLSEDEWSEPGGQNIFAESKLKCWFNIDKEMYWFLFGNKWSEPGGQNIFAESKIKCWLNMDKKMYWFLFGHEWSEPVGHNTFVESELKHWLSMDTNMYWFRLGNE